MGVIHRRAGEGWEGIVVQDYKDPNLYTVRKHELIGPSDGAQGYRVRCFQVPPGGRTARERHPHDHGVVILSGRARVTLEDQEDELGAGDVVYVAGDELHCFETVGQETLTFVCVVSVKSA